MKQLTYADVGVELGVHPYHVRRIVKRYPKLIQPVVEGYNRITFKISQVRAVKKARQRDAIKSLNHVAQLRRGKR